MILLPFNGRLYAPYYEDDGTFVGIRKDLGNGKEMSMLPNPSSSHWRDFLTWNAEQTEPLSLENISVTPLSTPVLDYAKPFQNNAALWVKLHKSLDEDRSMFDISTATGTTILAKLREQVKGIRDILANAPQAVQNEFHRERVLQGSTTPNPLNDTAIDAMTAAECRILIQVARLAANQGLAIVTAVNSLSE